MARDGVEAEGVLHDSGAPEEGDDTAAPPRRETDGAAPALTIGVAAVALAKSGVVEHGEGVDEGTTLGSIAGGGAKRKGGDPRGQRVLDPGSYDDIL